VAAYDPAAHPERHPALATRLPTTLGRLVLASLAIIVVMAGAIALAVSGPLFGRPLLEGEGRFAGTLAVLRAAVDPRAPLPLHVCLGVLSLVIAAAVAGSVRHMRRHRRDDYQGRFRAWGWLTLVLMVAAWAGAVPLGPLVAAVASEATGIVAGPLGIGWWLGLAAVAMAIVVPWAVLPLRERAGTAVWLALGLVAWGAAGAMPWAGAWVGGDGRGVIIAQAAWAGGAAMILIAMLAAARAVIREVRGEVAATPAKPRRAAAAKASPAKPASPPAATVAQEDDEAEESAAWASADDEGQTEYVDGSDHEQRHLSKAERKRLRKLARMNGQAA
jgi:MFS family permease